MSLPSELLELPRAERIKCMEMLWESLRSDSEMVSPDWHADIFSSRLDAAQTGEAKFISAEEMRQRLKR